MAEEERFKIDPENEIKPLEDEVPVVVDENGKKKKRRHGPLKVWTILLGVFGIISGTITLAYFLVPIIGVLVGIMLALIYIVIVVFLSILTLGLIWAEEGNRQTAGKIWDFVNWFFTITDHIAQVEVYFPIFAWVAIGFSGTTLLLSIIGTARKKEGGFIPWILVSAIFLLASAILIIFYYGSGGHILNNGLSSSSLPR